MSRDNNNLPSYRDFMENPDDLPSVEEFLEEKSLPSVNDFLSNPVEEEIVEEITEESTEKSQDLTEVLRLINDVRRDIPDVPEIKYYDEELKEISERISQIQEAYTKGDSDLVLQNEGLESKLEEIESKIPTVRYYDHDINDIHDKITGIKEELNNLPEVRYYEQDLDSLKSRIEQVNEAIPTFPDWVQEVQEVPDFSWIGKTFSLIDDDFNKVQGHLDIIREKIDFQVRELNDTVETKEFELKVDVKNLTEHFDKTVENLEETKDKLLKQVKDVSQRIWEQHHVSKDDDRKLKKSILSEQNKLKQFLLDEIKNLDQQSIKADEHILKFFTDLSNNVQSQFKDLPEVKYYDEDVTRIDGEILSLREELKELSRISNLIKVEQKNLKENYLLNEPPDKKETAGGQTDPLTPLDQKFATLDDLSAHYRLFINRITTQLATMGGGGAGFIKDLDDVTFDGTDGQLLIYNSTTSKWVGIASTAVGGGDASTLSENTTGTNLVLSGNLSVAGIATYEDVKNIDSVGIVTAQQGIRVGAGQSISAVSGIITYFGSAEGLTDIPAGQLTGTVADARITTLTSSKLTGALPAIDGSALTGVISGVGIKTEGGTVGFGVTFFDFRGAGISTITAPVSGISTINITGGGGDVAIDKQVYTATANQTSFTFDNSYTAGFVDVHLNGLKLIDGVDYTATNGSTVVLTTGATLSDNVEIIAFKVTDITDSLNSVEEENFTASANQTEFTTTNSFTSGNYIQVFKNGSKLRKTDFTATPGNTVTLDNACTVGDELDIVIFL